MALITAEFEVSTTQNRADMRSPRRSGLGQVTPDKDLGGVARRTGGADRVCTIVQHLHPNRPVQHVPSGRRHSVARADRGARRRSSRTLGPPRTLDRGRRLA